MTGLYSHMWYDAPGPTERVRPSCGRLEDETVGMREVWICDNCGAEERTDEGDGPPMTWNINIDNEDFCEKCSLLLDPYDPEADDDLDAAYPEQAFRPR